MIPLANRESKQVQQIWRINQSSQVFNSIRQQNTVFAFVKFIWHFKLLHI